MTGSAPGEPRGYGRPDLHPIVANWLRDPRLHAFDDDLGRSARRYGLGRTPETAPAPGMAVKLHLLDGLRRGSREFFEAHDYGWAFRPESYLVTAGSDPETADQSLRHQLTVLRTLVGVWDVVRGMRPPMELDLSGICARYVV